MLKLLLTRRGFLRGIMGFIMGLLLPSSMKSADLAEASKAARDWILLLDGDDILLVSHWRLYQDVAMTIPALVDGDPVGGWAHVAVFWDQSREFGTLVQENDEARPRLMMG